MILKKVKVAFCISFILLMVTLGISSYAAEINNFNVVEPTSISGTVTVSGNHSGGTGKVVVIKVTCEQSINKIYVDQMLTGSNGSFSFTYSLNLVNGLSGFYTIEVSGSGVSQKSIYNYTFINSTIRPQIITQINSATSVGSVDGLEPNTIANIINVNEFIFRQTGIKDENGFKKFSESDKTKIYSTLLGGGYDNVDTIFSVLKGAIAIQSLNIAQPSDVELILTNNLDVFTLLNIGADSEYGRLKDKSSVYAAVCRKNFGLKDITLVQSAFKKAVACQIFNEIDASNRSKLPDYVEQYQTEIGLTEKQFAEYKSLYNFTIMQGILDRKPYATLDMVKNTVLGAVADYKSTLGKGGGNSGGNSGGNGSGNGSGGSTSSKRTTTIKNSEVAIIPPVVSLFVDLNNVQWATESIQVLSQNGIVTGEGDGKFAPEKLVTREQFLKMLIKVFGIKEYNSVTKFNDVSETEWYYPYIATAENMGLINGVSENTFGIGMPITREEMAAMVYRFSKYTKVELIKQNEVIQFTDYTDISDYAKEAVATLQQANILSGETDNRFAPRDFSTRAMAAKILYSVFKLK